MVKLDMTPKEKVFYIFENIKKAHQDIRRIAPSVVDSSFYTFYRTIQADMFSKTTMKSYPFNIIEFMEMLTTPVETWGYFDDSELTVLEEEGVPINLSLITKRAGLNEDILVLLEENSFKEIVSEPIVKILKFCITKAEAEGNYPFWRNVYEEIRDFITDHPVHTERKRNMELKKFKAIDQSLVANINDCYEFIPVNKEFYVCQRCGWTAERTNNNTIRCAKSDCRLAFDASTIQLLDRKHDIRIKVHIQKSTTIPTLAERDVCEDIQKQSIVERVERYPRIEQLGDIAIYTKRHQYYVDVKDYKSPNDLIRYLIANTSKVKSPYIVITNNRNQNNYVSIVNKKLLENGITRFKVYSVKELINHIKKSEGSE